MKKTWVKRSDIYPRPFYKQKFKMLLLVIFLLGIIFLIYNFLSINELSQQQHQRSSLQKNEQYLEEAPAAAAQQTFSSSSGVNSKIAGATHNSGGEDSLTIIRGIRFFDYDHYKPNYDGNFKCLNGKQEIPFKRVNDDFCDCNDGTDEPSTNACANGKFYCKYQKRHLTGRGKDHFIFSSRVNDGVCDCCDGSDEWLKPFCKTTCLL